MPRPAVLAQEKAGYPAIPAPCVYFGACGGCALQDLTYADQLQLKETRIRQALAPLGDLPSFEIIPLEDPWRYRNKAELTFGFFDGAVTLGYHAARSFWKIVDLEDCLLLPEPMMRIARTARTLIARTGVPVYHPRSHQGIFRFLLVRMSQATQQVMVCFITASTPRELLDTLADELMAREPSVASVYWGVTDRLADIAVPETLTHLRGAQVLEEQIGPFRVMLHPQSFLQPSTIQADRLYRRLAQEAGVSSEVIAWDLYCGMGLISLYLAAQARRVYAIDSEPHHLEIAARNAALNEVTNVEFRLGAVETLLRDRRFWLQEAKPDVVVVDPPRAGLHADACASVLAARPSRIAYVSCNVQSLARDLQIFLTSFPRYRLSVLQPFDMFPQTNHVEILAILER